MIAKHLFLPLFLILLGTGGARGAADTTGSTGTSSAVVDLAAATAAFHEGNAAYERGDFADAVAAYERAEAAGARDARLYYNHANALFRTNQLGLSILHFEKARKLAPTDPDILHNLEFARTRVVDKVPEPPANFLTRLLWDVHSAYPLRAGVWIAGGLFAAGFMALTLGLFLPTLARIVVLTLATAGFAALLAFSPSLIYKLRQHGTAVRAVVVQPVTTLHSGPGESYELLFRAHEGTVFTIVSPDEDELDDAKGEAWIAVKLPDGRGGYVKAATVGKV